MPKVAIPLIAIAIIITAGVAYVVFGKQKATPSTRHDSQNETNTSLTGGAGWVFDGDAWQATGTPPPCPNPLTLDPPADFSKVTAILYPGQYRSGDYKAHGGFAFTSSKNEDINVTMPLDGYLVKASRYIEQGELQYFFVFINPCGIMIKLDHLADLTPQFQAIIDKTPEAKVNDSRTTPIEPAILVKSGEPIGTAVGFRSTNNVTFDLGVIDLRQKNNSAKDPAWLAKQKDDKEYAPYGVCWFDMFGPQLSQQLKSLPSHDSASGKQSDYC